MSGTISASAVHDFDGTANLRGNHLDSVVVPRYFVPCLTTGRSDRRAYARLHRVRMSQIFVERGPATTVVRPGLKQATSRSPNRNVPADYDAYFRYVTLSGHSR